MVYLILLATMKNNWIMALAAAFMAIGYGLMYSVLQSTAMLLAPISEQGLASSTFYLGLDIGMAFGPIIMGFINDLLPVKYFYLVQLVLIPFMILIYFHYRVRLNGAIRHH